jgi:hypothetical protein
MRLGFDRESPTILAAILGTCLVLLISAATIDIYKILHAPLTATVDPQTTLFWGPYHVNSYLLQTVPYYDGAGQRVAHRLALFAIAALVLAASFTTGIPRYFASLRWRKVIVFLAAVCTLGEIAAAFSHQSIPWFPLLIAVLFCAALCHPRLNQLRGLGRWLFAVACIFLLAAATIPAIFTTPDLADWSWKDVVFIQMHCSLVFGVGDHLAAGEKLFSQTVPTYGIFFQFFAAWYQRHVRTLTAGNYFHVLQALNAVYLSLSLLLLHRFTKGKWLLCLAGFALIVPWYHFRQHALWYPNLTGWRTLSFPLALLLCHACRRWPLVKSSLFFGLFAAVALLINIESGLAATAGLIAYIYFQHVLPSPHFIRASFIAASTFALGCAISFAAFFLLWGIALAPMPDFAQAPHAFAILRMWMSTNFGSAEFRWSLPAAAIFAHAVFILIYTPLTNRRAPRPFTSLCASAAAIIIIWFAYYMNRPDPLNIPGFLLPYSLLLVDLIRYLRIQIARRRTITTLSAAALAILIFAIIPELCFSWSSSNFFFRHAQAVATFSSPSADSAELVDGVYLAKSGADNLVAQADLLAQFPADQSPFYITQNSYLMPKLSGHLSPIPAMDVLWELTTEAKYHDFLATISQTNPQQIYLDSADSVSLGAEPYAGIYTQIRTDLTAMQYHPVSITSGWEIWRH